MSLRKGEAWGAVGPVPAAAVRCDGDAAAARVVAEARRAGRAVPPLHLVGGDLWRTCGGGGHPAGRDEVAILPVDLGIAVVDGEELPFVAHALARRGGWWFGRPLVAWMNAQYRGTWDVAPRSHPGDGRLDRVEAVRLGPRARWQAWRRLPTGAHVPHPGIAVRRVAEDDGPAGVAVWLDGVLVGRRVSSLHVRCEPAALTVCV